MIYVSRTAGKGGGEGEGGGGEVDGGGGGGLTPNYHEVLDKIIEIYVFLLLNEVNHIFLIVVNVHLHEETFENFAYESGLVCYSRE